jgi:dipeptidyl aminopeptidase/acylaminoacyl peptidase
MIALAAVTVSIALSALLFRTDPAGPATTGGAPRFIVATVGAGRPGGASRVEVRDVRTGRVHDARAASPGLTFQFVAAAADRVYFVLEAPIRQTACNALRIHRIKVSGAGRITTFAPVGVPLQGMTWGEEALPGGLAASPDGRRLAYAVRRCGDPAGRTFYKLGVADTTTGARHEWTDPQESIVSSPSWTSDARHVAFLRREPAHEPGAGLAPPSRNGAVRLLDTESRRSTDLLATKVLLRRSPELTDLWAAVINGDGTRMTVVAEYSRSGGALSVCQVSIADGRVLRMPHREGSESDAVAALPGLGPEVALRSDTSGRHLLYYDAGIAGASPDLGGYGRIDDGRFRGLPALPKGAGTYDLAW